MINCEELTPVEDRGGILFKRDDKFAPFGSNCVNGGKLRQSFILIRSEVEKNNINRLIAGCSMISLQGPIVAVTAREFGIDCTIVYGGTNVKSLGKNLMSSIAKKYGAKFHIAKSGRSAVLLHYARGIKKENDYIVRYSMDGISKERILATANQVENIPDRLDNLIVACGSGVTSTGILYGIEKFKKKVGDIYLVGTAPNREKKIIAELEGMNVNPKIKYIDYFGMGVAYSAKYKYVWGGIRMHPNYEGKAFHFLLNNVDYKNEKTLLWIVGKEPTRG